MKEFDWEFNKKRSSPARYSFYKENHDKPLTEVEFIEGMQKIRHLRTGRRTNYTPYKLKQEYKNLKEVFGFFV